MRDLKLLAVDTSTDACSCALWTEGKCRELFEVAPQCHAELLLPMMEVLLAEAGLAPRQLDGLAFGCGPGSFTGVRIAAAAVQGIALAADLPVAPVSSLRALAQGTCRELGRNEALAALDARMQEVYWGAYRADANGIMQVVTADLVCRPGSVPSPGPGAWFGVGSGWGAYAEALCQAMGGAPLGAAPDRHPRARDVATLGLEVLAMGQGVAAELALPVYLRDKVV